MTHLTSSSTAKNATEKRVRKGYVLDTNLNSVGCSKDRCAPETETTDVNIILAKIMINETNLNVYKIFLTRAWVFTSDASSFSITTSTFKVKSSFNFAFDEDEAKAPRFHKS